MQQHYTIKSALVSVFSKEGLEPIVQKLNELGVTIYSTGGTETFIKSLGIQVVPVEGITNYPSILGGRVKTLHPKIFGGILNRQSNELDAVQMVQYSIPQIDLVIVDLYPFEKTLTQGGTSEEIIEKIDIGGISLIRAAAKNFNDTLCVSSKSDYPALLTLLEEKRGQTSLSDRKRFAAKAFNVSSHYDTAIFNYFNQSENIPALKLSQVEHLPLRYGENPHQKGAFYGDFSAMFEKLHGKELSYNNLLDIDAAVNLISEFTQSEPTFAILKHNNACGVAMASTLAQAYEQALACDPVSAFGGILIGNRIIDKATAELINPLFCEVVIAPNFEAEALEILQSKKNRILLKLKTEATFSTSVRSCLNGYLVQERDGITDSREHLRTVTTTAATDQQVTDLLFASKICKHTKSNSIILAKNGQLIAGGTGQTSRVDALKQAIEKAREFGFSLQGAVMASDAFFPFPDCVEIAHKVGIAAVIQPGGSVKDQLSIDYCNENGMVMVFTGVRHFKH